MISCVLSSHVFYGMNDGGLKWDHLKSSSSPTETYLHYHSGYDRQTWQGGDHEGLPPIKSHDPLIM